MRDPHRSRARQGFTLVELIVALLLLTIGLGALAGTTVWLLRERIASQRAERAATIAHARLEMLRVGGCASATGTATHGELLEQWTRSVTGSHATAVVSVAGRHGVHVPEQRYHAALSC